MFSRREDESLIGVDIPIEWKEEMITLLEENFKIYLEQNNKCFDVFGKIYTDEIAIVVSCLQKEDIQFPPLSCFISLDFAAGEATQKVIHQEIDQIMDLGGSILDDVFADKDWNDFSSDWLETEFRKKKYFYKITRENVALTLEVNKWLSEEKDH